ncbi:16S rRNA (guanine(527)-N(7))-methyltransferase RsmG [Ichthyobacterium seriolicida]|uniref:Ribosomal RNA small subunit methyltransferase G n=1 Tax=Ichthyobacterium seriolicida TaxID=242600 RepID=A0A1J1EB76_9FLAO|nr:16S rRNA (guanine(527)-N(7))-methyltransferase RsmG [Ichthyobacterium seriolicida]BAV95187.1 16S rRNA methyltransferase [Ichthyobacterium seriolicida]
MNIDLIRTYFDELDSTQIEQFSKLDDLYKKWNAKINVVSRKDIDNLYLRHVLHSLSIAKVQGFIPKSDILDVGTGGGFPGIPLSILFPQTNFYLVDSILKKTKVTGSIAESLGLKNVLVKHMRAEDVLGKFDFILSRAVTDISQLSKWVGNKISKKSNHKIKNGILSLKGGDLSKELSLFPNSKEYKISDFFSESFFEDKKIVHVPL